MASKAHKAECFAGYSGLCCQWWHKRANRRHKKPTGATGLTQTDQNTKEVGAIMDDEGIYVEECGSCGSEDDEDMKWVFGSEDDKRTEIEEKSVGGSEKRGELLVSLHS